MDSGSFNRKIIRTTIILDPKSGTFPDKKSNEMITQGLRTSCRITYGNGQFMPTSSLNIWGLPKDSMNKLTSIKWNVEGVQNNIIKIEAGDDPKNLDVVYQGNISFAYPDYSMSPDVSLCIESNMALYHQLSPVVPTSYKGEADVAEIMANLAKEMGIGFENNGVVKKLNNQYLSNTAFEQVKEVAQIADIEYHMEFNKLIICNKGQPRQNRIAVLTPKTGLLSYPVPTNIGATLQCLYNRNIKAGDKIMIKDSLIEQCNGTWRVTGMDIELEAEVSNGAWFMDINIAQIGDAGNAPTLPK